MCHLVERCKHFGRILYFPFRALQILEVSAISIFRQEEVGLLLNACNYLPNYASSSSPTINNLHTVKHEHIITLASFEERNVFTLNNEFLLLCLTLLHSFKTSGPLIQRRSVASQMTRILHSYTYLWAVCRKCCRISSWKTCGGCRMSLASACTSFKTAISLYILEFSLPCCDPFCFS